MKKSFITLGPVIQSVVSLWKSLVEDLLSFTILTKSAIVIFLLNNCKQLLHCYKSSSHFSAKNGSVFAYFIYFIP